MSEVELRIIFDTTDDVVELLERLVVVMEKTYEATLAPKHIIPDNNETKIF